MAKVKTLTARQLIRNQELSLDSVYAVVNRYGMDPRRLYPDDVAKIRDSIEGSRKGRGKRNLLEDTVLAMPAIDGKVIIRLTNTKERTARYMFAEDLNNLDPATFAHDMSFDEFLAHVETDLDYQPHLTKPTVTETRDRETGSGDEQGTRKPGRKRERVTIEGRLASYLLGKREDMPLRAMLYGDPQDEPVDLTHSTTLLRGVLSDEMLGTLKAHGYTLQSFTPEALMKLAQTTKRRRLRNDVKQYFAVGNGKFITARGPVGFDLSWDADDDITKVISWLEPRIEEPEKGLPFYLNCVRTKLSKELVQKHGPRRVSILFNDWIMAASQLEFVRAHPYTKPLVSPRAKERDFEDIAFKMVKELAHKQDYSEGDARRFLGGLYVAGKATPRTQRTDESTVGNYQTAVRLGNDVDYLLTKYDEIGAIVSTVMQRIKDSQLQEDSVRANQKLYEKIREGTFQITGPEEARHFGRAVRAQMIGDEKAQFPNRLKKGTFLSDSSIDRILGWYALAEKDKI